MSHLKRLYAPSKWHIARKDGKFIVRPSPSGHEMGQVLPLLVVMRDVLHHVQTARELRVLFKQKPVLVNGKRQDSEHASIGLLDVLSLPDVDKHYRMTLTPTGKLALISISAEESKMKIAKVIRKNVVTKGKIQATLQDGRTVLVDNTLNVGDSVLLQLPEGKATKIIELKKGVPIYITKGKASGVQGTVVDFEGTEKVIYEDQQKNRRVTLKKYVVALGEDAPLISLEEKQ